MNGQLDYIPVELYSISCFCNICTSY